MHSLLKLKPYLRPYIWVILISTLLAIPLSAIRMGPAPVVKYMLDDLLIHKDTSRLWLLPVAVVGLYLVNFVIRFFHYYLLRVVIVRVNQKIRDDLFKHLLGLSADYYTHQSTGTLISRTSSDPQYIDGGLACINVLIREPFTLIFLFGYALHLNWRLTLITLTVLPLLAWLFTTTGKHLKRYILRTTEMNAKLYSTLQESFTGIRVVKAFRLEKFLHKKFREKNQLFANLLLKISLLEESSHPFVELLTAFALAPIIYYGGRQVVLGTMTPGDLFAFFTAFALMMNPIRMMNDLNIKLHQASAACERIFEIFEWKSNLQETPNPLPLKEFKSTIELSNVGFAYPDAPEKKVLSQITFQIPKGKAVAIVGASGAGKSSLVSLLPRIYDITEGSIRIDGKDIRTVSLEDLRRMIAIVSQDVFLFNDTIEENIRCGDLSASPEKIRLAAQKAHCMEFVDKLSLGMQTVIGDRGQKLSGGERQRLSIARAFLREAPILILDEATSSLDTASEKEVRKALEGLMANRTTLIIAHRLSTIRSADFILVLKDGRIVEQGDHSQLIDLNGEYARFHQIGELAT